MMLLILLLAASCWAADTPAVALSRYVKKDFKLSADPRSKTWKDAPAVVTEAGPRSEPVPGHRTEVRSLWTRKNLYLLFICPYEALNLKPSPVIGKETNKLWNWDVAEVFIGSDFQNIQRYKEFQVSPRGEWVDLDIDKERPLPEGGWMWNSGFEVKAKVDRKKKIWYGEMRIPIAKIDTRAPQPGRELRINFYRIQGEGPERKFIAWQPTGFASYHIPERFGVLKLVN